MKNKKNKIIGIYIITSPSGRKNVGQSWDIHKRFNYDYKYGKCKGQSSLYESFQKYGVKNHTFEILEVIQEKATQELTQLELNEREIFYIKKFNTRDKKYGMNLKEGGSYGKHSEETKIKIGLKYKGKIISEKTREKMRIGQKSIKEWKSKNASKWQTGRKLSESHKLNISISHKGKKYALGNKHTQETKDKISQTHKGNKYNVGIKRSVEFKKMISLLHKGKPKTKEQKMKMSIARKKWHEKNKKK